MRQRILLLLALIFLLSTVILTVTACSSKSFETNVHEFSEEFTDITIKTDTADILFLPSDDEICRVSCYEDKNAPHSVKVQEGTLTVEAFESENWFDNVGINFGSPEIKIYLPKAEYSALAIKESTGDVEIPKDFSFNSIEISLSTGDVRCRASAKDNIKIAASTGDIHAEGLSASSIELTVSTGMITVSNTTCDNDLTVGVSTGKAFLTDITCRSLASTGNTGDISLKNVISSKNISIERSTGDVRLERSDAQALFITTDTGDVTFKDSDAEELFITTDTGDVEGSLLTSKIFIAKTDTGRVDVPNSVTGGRCEITTDTGDIKITISGS